MPLASLDIICASLADNSLKQYEGAFRRWNRFCNENNVDFYGASIPNVISFLTEIFKSGAQYGTLNSIRSGLSIILGPRLSADDRVKRLFKGFYRIRPPFPKYEDTWDPSIVLDFLSLKYPAESLDLAWLTKKTATLIALVTALRMQTISKIKLKNISINSDSINIKIPDLIKTSRPGTCQPNLYLPFFNIRPEICPASTLLKYLERTKELRGNIESLFISVKKPYKAISSQTLCRWTKETLCESGIDTTMFSAHSTRHAATSSAHRQGVHIDTIRNTAGWSGSSTVFAKFYHRNITKNNRREFALSLLDPSY